MIRHQNLDHDSKSVTTLDDERIGDEPVRARMDVKHNDDNPF